jgi:hypothetical protein
MRPSTPTGWGIALAGACLLAQLAAPSAATARDDLEQKLRTRCLTAIGDGELAPALDELEETMTVPIPEGSYLFQFASPGVGTVSCQVCDSDDPAFNCGELGLRLTLQAANGDFRDLPAELDRKCVGVLQKEIGDTGPDRWIDHSVVERVAVEADHTESRWVYRMTLDDDVYRCVIRKSDGSWRVERRAGDEWRSLGSAGIFF